MRCTKLQPAFSTLDALRENHQRYTAGEEAPIASEQSGEAIAILFVRAARAECGLKGNLLATKPWRSCHMLEGQSPVDSVLKS